MNDIEQYLAELLARLQRNKRLRMTLAWILILVLLGLAGKFAYELMPRKHSLTITGGSLLSQRHFLARVLEEEAYDRGVSLKIVPVSGSLDALEQALHARPDASGVVHHSDRGVQYTSIRYTERLAAAGVERSVGSVGDSYDNALAESINGLYKTEVIHRRGPWRTIDAVEYATLVWVDWFNNRRLLAPIGYVPPAEYEDVYYRQQESQAEAA